MADEEAKVVSPIEGLMDDLLGEDPTAVRKEAIHKTIESIITAYNLSTNTDFVTKIAQLKLPDGEKFSIDMLPRELQDAAFLPVNTIADIALKQDLDLVMSQIPEWFTAIQITRDAVCESDTVDGTLARDIIYDKSNLSDSQIDNNMKKIEAVEDRLELHDLIKNQMVTNTLQYGEGSIYCIPYAKVFEDLWNYRMKSKDRDNKNSVASMFASAGTIGGFGYSESGEIREISLKDAIIQEQSADTKTKTHGIFTESEIMEIYPSYHNTTGLEGDDKKQKTEYDKDFDAFLDSVAENIRYCEGVAVPVLEDSPHDIICAYKEKHKDDEETLDSPKTFFEYVQESDNNGKGVVIDTDETSEFHKLFGNIKGVYLRSLPPTKLIPVRLDRTIIGYYYISDGTRPEETGERKNSGLTGYTLRTPSVGFDTFSPDRMFCDRLATKIINNFNLKFMRDNTALHEQIVAVLESHRFNDTLMRFIFIPAEYVVTGAINKDGSGKGHSMMEPGLVTARMYMFLKLYSVLFQINNSGIRVYNLRQSGMDKNYAAYISEIVRKFAARRMTASDIFNYKRSMSKITGYSELVMPLGTQDKPPLDISAIPAVESPIAKELLDELRNEALNATPVPSIMLNNGGVTEPEFAKETELANTRFLSFVMSVKLDMNRPVTHLYRKILRWTTDIDPAILAMMKFKFRMPTLKSLKTNNEKLNNLQAIMDLAVSVMLTEEEQKGKDGNAENPDVVRNFKKLLIADYCPELDVERWEELVQQARKEHVDDRINSQNPEENMVDAAQEEG